MLTAREERDVVAGSCQLRSKVTTCATRPIDCNAHLRPLMPSAAWQSVTKLIAKQERGL